MERIELSKLFQKLMNNQNELLAKLVNEIVNLVQNLID